MEDQETAIGNPDKPFLEIRRQSGNIDKQKDLSFSEGEINLDVVPVPTSKVTNMTISKMGGGRDGHWFLVLDVQGKRRTKILQIDLTKDSYRIYYGFTRDVRSTAFMTTEYEFDPTSVPAVYAAVSKVANERGRWEGVAEGKYNCQDFVDALLAELGARKKQIFIISDSISSRLRERPNRTASTLDIRKVIKKKRGVRNKKEET